MGQVEVLLFYYFKLFRELVILKYFEQLLRERVLWNNMDNEKEDIIKCCHACKVTKVLLNNKQPIVSTEITSSSWVTLAMDIHGPYLTNNYLVVLIDNRSRWHSSITNQKPNIICYY